MRFKPEFKLLGVGLALLLANAAVAAVDVAQAEMLARQSGCFKCHSVEKKKDGPAYRAVAAKYRDQADARSLLYLHVTSGPKVKFPDGSEDSHKIIQTRDEAAINNLIDWILSL